jgi:hypothetical protein
LRYLFQILVLWSGSIYAQIAPVDCKSEFAFLKHTMDQGLVSESAAQFDRLNLISCNHSHLKDTLAYKLGLLCMENGFDSEEFMTSIGKSHKELSFRASLAMQFQRIEFQQYIETDFESQATEGVGSDLRLSLFEAERILKNPFIKNGRIIGNNNCLRLYEAQDQYLLIKRKSPFLAGALSMVVPGLGKLYANDAGQFVMTLLPNLVFAGQAAEAFIHGGTKDSRFIVFTSITGIFYVGNIYSSVKSVQRIKKKAYENLHRTILDIVRQPTIKYLRSEF